MLVLTRKLGESIVINEEIAVKVVWIKGTNIRLGVEAPHSVSVRRGELPRLNPGNGDNNEFNNEGKE